VAIGAAPGSLLMARLRGELEPVEHRTLMPVFLRNRGSTVRCRS